MLVELNLTASKTPLGYPKDSSKCTSRDCTIYQSSARASDVCEIYEAIKFTFEFALKLLKADKFEAATVYIRS